jgi:hypothetical protein
MLAISDLLLFQLQRSRRTMNRLQSNIVAAKDVLLSANFITLLSTEYFMKIVVSCGVTERNLVDIYKMYGGTRCL